MDACFISNRMFLNNEFVLGGILVGFEGKITKLLRNLLEVNSYLYENDPICLQDFADLVLMPGLIDPNVHINEPGNEEWEGFLTATKAAAAGGFTSICDMPLHSKPSTITVDNLRNKAIASKNKCYVDVGFWGGITPTNTDQLVSMEKQGVIGFKCSLAATGVDDFPPVDEKSLQVAIDTLRGTDTVISFNAVLNSLTSRDLICDEAENPKCYYSYLRKVPEAMEVDGVKIVTNLAKQKIIRTHINHLSSAAALPLIRECRNAGGLLTVDTCPHYLTLAAEEIPTAATEYKCSPPIRSLVNQQPLWGGIKDKYIDMITSDHSPSTPGLKMITPGKTRGNFYKALDGISSLQYGLPIVWTKFEEHGLTLADIVQLMCIAPAHLCGLEHQKGKLAEGFDADFVVWDPDATFTCIKENTYFKHKQNPYLGKTLKGIVHYTILRGTCVYNHYDGFTKPQGRILIKTTLKGN